MTCSIYFGVRYSGSVNTPSAVLPSNSGFSTADLLVLHVMAVLILTIKYFVRCIVVLV